MRFKIETSEDEVYVINVLDKMLSKEHVKKVITPLTGICYLSDPESGSRMRIDSKTVDIYVGNNLIKKAVSGNTSNKLYKAVKDSVEEELISIDKELEEAELELLKHTLKQLD